MRLWARAVSALHATVCGALTGVLALEIANHQTSLRATKLIIVAVVGTIVGGLLVAFVSVVRQFLRFLAIGAIAFVPLFLFASPAANVRGPTTPARSLPSGPGLRIESCW